MRTRTLISAVVLGLSGLAGAGPAGAEIGLRAEIAISRADGSRSEEWRSGDFARLSVAFSDALTGAGAKGLTPLGFLRRVEPGAPSCAAAAQAVRATRRVSRDDVALSGHWLVSLGEDHRLSVLDPARPFGRGHLLSVTPLGERPGPPVLRRSRDELLVARPERGDVLNVRLPEGAMRVLASGLSRPGSVAEGVGGAILVAEDAGARVTMIAPDGSRVPLTTLPAGPVSLVPAGPDRILAHGPDGSGVLLRADTGALAATFAPGSLGSAPTATSLLVLSAPVDKDHLGLRYLDDPNRVIEIPLPRPARGVAVSPDGRMAVAWSAGGALDVVDLALAQRVKGFEGSGEVEEVAFSGSAAFATWRERAVVTVIDLASPATIATRDIRLAATAKRPSGPGDRRLAPLRSSMLTSLPGSGSLFDVAVGGGLSSAPMRILRLGTEPSIWLAAAERGLRETSPGHFETDLRLPDGGGVWELVATTGPGGTTACRSFDLGGRPAEERTLRVVSPAGGVQAGQSVRLVVSEASASGDPTRPLSGALVAAELAGSWRRSFPLRAEPDGTVIEAWFPRPGLYPLTIADEVALTPFLLEVKP